MPSYTIKTELGPTITLEAPDDWDNDKVLAEADLAAGDYLNDQNTRRLELGPVGDAAYNNMGQGEAALRGAGQGILLGGMDEAGGAVAATLRSDIPGGTWLERYNNARDAIGSTQKAANLKYPVTSTLSQIGGGVIGTALPASKLPLPATGLGRAAQASAAGGATGGVSGALSSDGDLADRAEAGAESAAVGALTAPILPLAWEGAKLGGRIVRNVADPLLPGGAGRNVGRLGNIAAGTKREAVINALLKNEIKVKGSLPNSGQASVPAGSAEFAALQKIADEAGPSAAVAKDIAQEQARQAAIGTIARDKKVLRVYELNRKAQASRNYGKAFEEQINADPELLEIFKNPYVKAAIPTARSLAEARGITPKKNLTEFLHYVKIGVDKQLQRTGDTALARTEKRAAQSAQSNLVEWLGKKNPAYDTARTRFHSGSKPIEQIKAGQELQDALMSPLAGAERASVFATAVRNNEDLGKTLTPGQMGTVSGVADDLARDAQYGRLASAGRKAARSAVGEISNPVHQVNFLERTMMIVNAILRRAEGKGSGKTLSELSTVMNDPARMAGVMKAATPFERREIVDAIMRAQAAGIGSAAGKEK